jgi:hypothetical protein
MLRSVVIRSLYRAGGNAAMRERLPIPGVGFLRKKTNGVGFLSTGEKTYASGAG